MGGELSPQVEGAAAELADERLVTGMDIVVLLQVDRLPETLVAVVALERQIRLVLMPQHVNAQSCQHGGLVVALLAHVAGVKMGLLVSGQVAEQPELLGTVLAREVAYGVPHQMPLVIAFMSKHLVAGLAEKLQIRLLFLHLQRCRAIHHRRAASFTATFAAGVLLHMLPQVHVRSEHPATLSASVFAFTLVLDLVIVQQSLGREEHAALFTVVGQW